MTRPHRELQEDLHSISQLLLNFTRGLGANITFIYERELQGNGVYYHKREFINL